MRLATALGSVKKGQEALVPRPAQSVPLAEAAAKSKRVAFDAQQDAAALDAVEVPT